VVIKSPGRGIVFRTRVASDAKVIAVGHLHRNERVKRIFTSSDGVGENPTRSAAWPFICMECSSAATLGRIARRTVKHIFLCVASMLVVRAAFQRPGRSTRIRRGVKPMGGSGRLTEDLRHDLDETRRVINILERARGELTAIIAWDEAPRKNPLRQRQLSSIVEQLAITRVRQASIASMIEQLEAKPSSYQAMEPGRPLMQIDDGRSTGNPAMRDEVDYLLRGRMKILGLDVDAIGREFREAFDKIRKNCPRCGYREACAIDLRHDPRGLIWEAYCPNSHDLNVLVALTEAAC
jgi:hypothetical protein